MVFCIHGLLSLAWRLDALLFLEQTCGWPDRDEKIDTRNVPGIGPCGWDCHGQSNSRPTAASMTPSLRTAARFGRSPVGGGDEGPEVDPL